MSVWWIPTVQQHWPADKKSVLILVNVQSMLTAVLAIIEDIALVDLDILVIHMDMLAQKVRQVVITTIVLKAVLFH